MVEMVRPGDVDQVYFLGQNTFQIARFGNMYPATGSPDYTIIEYGEPYLLGLLTRSKIATGVDNRRIMKDTVMINNKRTLIVFAELTAVDKNVSLIDMVRQNDMSEIRKLKVQVDYSNAERRMRDIFLKSKHIEGDWEEFMQNAVERFKVASSKLAPRMIENPEVNVDVTTGQQPPRKK